MDSIYHLMPNEHYPKWHYEIRTFCGATPRDPKTGKKLEAAILAMDHEDGCQHIDLWRTLCKVCEHEFEKQKIKNGPYR